MNELETVKRNKTIAKVLLVISGINIGMLCSIVLPFLVLWFLFGAFGDADTYVNIISLILGYAFASVIAFIGALYNNSKNGEKLKETIISIIVSFIAGFCFSFILFGGVSIFSKHIPIENNAVIFSDESDTVYQKSLIQDKEKLELKLKIDNHEQSFSSVGFEREYVIINGKEIPAVFDKRDYYGSTYIVRIKNEDLKNNNITEIKSFVMIAYSDYEHEEKTEIHVKFKK